MELTELTQIITKKSNNWMEQITYPQFVTFVNAIKLFYYIFLYNRQIVNKENIS